MSIVVPAYNEKRRLPSTLQALSAYCQAGLWDDVEILVVDDGSKDGTPELVQGYLRDHPEVKLLRNPGNRGKGYSVRHGMLEASGQWVLFTDADLSSPIEELAKLTTAVDRSAAEIAIGSRAIDRSLIGVHQSPLREVGGRFFNLVVQAGTGLRLWDTQCGFKLFRHDAAKAVFRRLTLERFGFDAEALFIAKHLGYRIVEVPVLWNHVDGTKINLLSDSADMFLDIARIRWNQIQGRYR